MQHSRRAPRLSSAALAATGLAAMLILIGALIWYRPYLVRRHQAVTGVPTPRAKFKAHDFYLRSHQQACLDLVTVDPKTRVAMFELVPTGSNPAGDQALELVLRAPGYRTVARVSGLDFEEHAGNQIVQVPFTPPRRALIGSACFINRGRATVVLEGNSSVQKASAVSAPGSVSRSAMTIGGRPVAGDIALKFLDSGRHSLLERLGEVFDHASVLTDQLIPVWLVWLLAVLVALGVPLGVLAALYLALSEDDATAAS